MKLYDMLRASLRFKKKTEFLDKSENYRYLTGFFRTEVKT